MSKFDTDWTSRPRSTIDELMRVKGMSQEDVALAMCDDPADEAEYGKNYLILEFIFHLPDETRMTVAMKTCKRLEKSIGGSAQFWFNRFENHRLGLLAGKTPTG